MFDIETLERLAGSELVAAAGEAMDLESVSAFRLDSRGRMEGGVKPAPPSTEAPAYVRITKRGAKCVVDCRVHGRGGWCIHAAILALHHLGRKPYLKQVKPVAPPRPKLGFQMVASFDASGAHFRVRSLSTNQFVANPLRFVKREPKALSLSGRALEILEDLAEAEEWRFTAPRLDLAPLLTALETTPLFDASGAPFRFERAARPEPLVAVRVEEDRIHWEATPPLEPGSVLAPGWPGYIVVGARILRYPGCVADFQALVDRDGAPLPLTAEHLALFAGIQHQIEWATPRPRVIRQAEPPGLRLEEEHGDLVGRFGFWSDDRFFALNGMDRPLQLLNDGARPALLWLNPIRWTSLSAERDRLRAPWQAASFRLPRGQARRFLEEARFPEKWRVARTEADRWFGAVRQSVVAEWDDDLTPRYRIAEETFDHAALMGGLLGDGGGVRLPDGRTLNIDCGPLMVNERIMAGARALHADPARQRDLLRLIAGKSGSERGAPPLAGRWRELLRGYQRRGVEWLMQNFANEEPSLLADDMGLGKTIQTLAFLDMVKTDLPQLVVAPASLLHNWRAESKKFSPNRRVVVHHGPKRARAAEALQQADLVVTSYGSLRRDIDWLYDVEFQVVVLDEAQAVKNAASQAARAVGELWSQGRVALTGTPVENRLTELWSIFQFLAPGYLGDEDDVRAIGPPGAPGFQALKAKTAPFLLRRRKSEVEPDLPQKQEITVSLPMSEGQAELYADTLRAVRRDVDGRSDAVSILAKLTRLRQICCHPGLVNEGLMAAESNKFTYLLEKLEEIAAAGHAALVFSQFTSLLKLLRFQLEKRELDFLYLDGQTRNRHELVTRFQAGAAPLFLISLKAGGTGLNLTRASYVFHLDPWWNPMVEAQATDRAHRIGQTQRVLSYKLISEETVEARILKLQAGKRRLAEGLFAEEPGALDREALLALLT